MGHDIRQAVVGKGESPCNTGKLGLCGVNHVPNSETEVALTRRKYVFLAIFLPLALCFLASFCQASLSLTLFLKDRDNCTVYSARNVCRM